MVIRTPNVEISGHWGTSEGGSNDSDTALCDQRATPSAPRPDAWHDEHDEHDEDEEPKNANHSPITLQ